METELGSVKHCNLRRQKVRYESVDDPTNRILFDATDGSIIVRDFDDSLPSTIVMIGFFDGLMLSRDHLYQLLACKCNRDQSNKNDRTIASVRWAKHVKGVPGKCFDNAVVVEIWLNGKKAHTKVSSKKIQICGVKSPQIGNLLAEIVVDHLFQVQEYIEKIKSEEYLFVEAIQWLIDNSFGDSLEVYASEPIEAPNGKGKCFAYGEMINDYKIQYPSDIPKEYCDHVRQFIDRTTDLSYHYQLVKRANLFSTISDIVTPDFGLNRTTYSMINHNYYLGFVPNRYKLIEKLNELGYDSNFANMAKSLVVVKILSKEPNDVDMITRKKALTKCVQTFTFYPKGSLLQSGCDEDTMRSCYCQLMLDLVKIKNDIEIKIKAKK